MEQMIDLWGELDSDDSDDSDDEYTVSEAKFPFHVQYVQFARYSIMPYQRITTQPPHGNTSATNNTNQKNIIIGGAYRLPESQSSFYEIDLALSKNSKNEKLDKLVYTSFATKYNASNARIKHNAKWTHSYLVNDSKYLIVFDRYIGYNVYDIMNDNWLLGSNNTTISYTDHGARSLLLNEEILMVSCSDVLDFYYIGNDHITKPIEIGSQELQATFGIDYLFHGMCCIDFKIEYQSTNGNSNSNSNSEDQDENKIENSDIETIDRNFVCTIFLFGCSQNLDDAKFLDSFLKLKIRIFVPSIFKTNKKSIKISVDTQESIEIKPESVIIDCDIDDSDPQPKESSSSTIATKTEKTEKTCHGNDNAVGIGDVDHENKTSDTVGGDDFIVKQAKKTSALSLANVEKAWNSFSWELMMNGKGEPVIIIIGGLFTDDINASLNKTVGLFNCTSNVLTIIPNVE